jgi:hypothetical protein
MSGAKPAPPPKLPLIPPERIAATAGKWRVEGNKLRVWQFTTLPKVDLLNGATGERLEESALRLTPWLASGPLFWLCYFLFFSMFQLADGVWSWIALASFILTLVGILGWEAGVEKLSLRSFVSVETTNSTRRKENWSTGIGVFFMALLIGSDWLDNMPTAGRYSLLFTLIVLPWWSSRQGLKCRKAGKDASGRSQFLVSGIHPDALRYLATHAVGTKKVAENSVLGS